MTTLFSVLNLTKNPSFLGRNFSMLNYQDRLENYLERLRAKPDKRLAKQQLQLDLELALARIDLLEQSLEVAAEFTEHAGAVFRRRRMYDAEAFCTAFADRLEEIACPL
jgi:hypothetical protein